MWTQSKLRRSREQSKFICSAEALQYMWTQSKHNPDVPVCGSFPFRALNRMSQLQDCEVQLDFRFRLVGLHVIPE